MGKSRSWFGRGNSRAILISTAVFALLVTPFAFAVGEGEPVEGGERNPNSNRSQAYQRETELIGRIGASGAQKGGYVTRQSNTSTGANAGGGAIYGCRSTGQDPDNDESCIRANNLANGLAFSFDSNGTLGGIISVGDGGDEEKPFVTNATGVATGLNADRVDGIDGAQIQQALQATQGQATRWAMIDNQGNIVRQTGGFTTVNCYQANANCYIDAGEDVRNNGVHASIIATNNPDSGTDGLLTGETAAAPCGLDIVNCGPEGTEDNEVIVVTPRNSDGSAPADDDRYFFYAFVTGSDSQ